MVEKESYLVGRMPAPRPAPGRHNGGGSGGARKRGQKYQNTFAFKHNNSSKKTEHILSLPVGGVCQRCYDQLMWRKAFRKFKPRTVFGRCNHCAKKNVKNAYCTICRDCATKAKCCAKCGRAKATVPFQKTDEELRADEQRLAYEMQFMKERERRKIQREQAKANDKYLQRQLRRLAEGKSTDAGFGGTNRVSASGAGAAADALGAADIDWKSLEQPTDLASQVCHHVATLCQRTSGLAGRRRSPRQLYFTADLVRMCDAGVGAANVLRQRRP